MEEANFIVGIFFAVHVRNSGCKSLEGGVIYDLEQKFLKKF